MSPDRAKPVGSDGRIPVMTRFQMILALGLLVLVPLLLVACGGGGGGY